MGVPVPLDYFVLRLDLRRVGSAGAGRAEEAFVVFRVSPGVNPQDEGPIGGHGDVEAVDGVVHLLCGMM